MTQKKKRQEQEEASESLLEAMLSGISAKPIWGREPFVRMIEQDGQKFFQLLSRDVSDEDDEDEKLEGRKQSGNLSMPEVPSHP